MNSHPHIRNPRKFTYYLPVATDVPKRHSPLALVTTLAMLLTTLTISGCVGLTSAGAPAKTSSGGTPSGTIAANATNFSFGNVPSGSSTSQTLTLSNTGTAAVMISQATVTGAGFSVVGGMNSVSIPAGQSYPFQIQFAPQTAGTVGGSVVVASDATDSALSISLSGTGTATVSISAQPASQSVTVGQTATFSVTATGSGTLSYQWKKNAATISGANSSTYTTPATILSDNGAVFAVVVTDSTSSVTSTAGTLTVTPAPVPPSITTQPASQAVTAGQTATFSVIATGTATLTYQWSKNGTVIGGATAASYTTPATTASDNGAQFTVTITNSVGNVTSNAATLTVNVPPTITTQPLSQTVIAGQTATLSVAATSTGTITYQWKKNGTAIGGATLASYTTPAAAASDNGAQFTVTVTANTINVTSNTATLTVNVPPSITTQPVSKTVTVGQTAAFSVVATGTAILTYQWSKNGTAIGGATLASYTTPATIASDNGAQFTVNVINSFGNVTSNVATLTVNVPPTITTQPVSQTVTAGQTATFSVAATGSGTITYQWKKNGTAIGGATSASYTTPATVASDNGAQFTITVTDLLGNVTSNAATLTVNVPPTITTQPASKTVIAGQTATFTVTAAGTATLTYQWSKNGTAIGGATSASYTTPATTASDNGAQFTVTVTNIAGNKASNAATLTVNPATFLLNANKTTLAFGNVNIGSNSILGVILTNAGNSNVTVSNVSISGAGYTANGVSMGQILTPGQTATLNVTFTPATAVTVPGSVTVTSNATNSPATVTLSGTGVTPVPHSVTLNWTASTSTVSGYNVYVSPVSGGPTYTKINSTLVTTTQYTDSNVLSGQTYFYVVTAVDSSNVESLHSNEVPATIP
jgi:hypothetical protein